MGLSQLDSTVRGYFRNALTPATLAMYHSAANRYTTFCASLNLPSLPLDQSTLTRFVAHLGQSGLAYQSIRAYLSGIRFLQIASGLPDPHLEDFPLLDYVLRGIHRVAQPSTRQQRRPITPRHLTLLHTVWSSTQEISQHDAAMLWAACCVGFFGFMRAGEFTCQSWQAYTPDKLGPQDVSVNSHQAPSVLSLRLRRSKVDPFGNGVTICLGSTGRTICPVAALLSYLAQRGRQPGPLFLFSNGHTLSKNRLMHHVRRAISGCGGDASGIMGHSFRIGAATAAAQAELEDSLIQTLGRWHSAAFQRYIRTPAHQLAASTTRLLPPDLTLGLPT